MSGEARLGVFHIRIDIKNLIKPGEAHDLTGLSLEVGDLDVPTATTHAVVQKQKCGKSHA